MQKPYYNHDEDWQNRTEQGNPRWGGQSEKVYAKFISWLRDENVSAGNLLDAGCGAGAFGLKVRELGMRYTGIDESPVAIALGQKSFHANADMTLMVLDVANAELPSGWQDHFSVVTSINVLHCLTEAKDRHGYLKFLYAALQPGGRLLLSTMCGPPSPDFRPSRQPRIYAEVSRIHQELSEAGFRTIEREEAEPTENRSRIPNLMLLCRKP